MSKGKSGPGKGGGGNRPGGGRGKTTRVKTARGRTVSQTRWLQRQLNDPYVEAAKRQGYRSRAAYKLAELDDKIRSLKRMKKALQKVAEDCPGKGPTQGCPILLSLTEGRHAAPAEGG